ncbi:MAG: aspartate kinase [Candidatus Bathycorpusculaceae bacterium]
MKENMVCCRKIVVKYGGSSLADYERISKAANAVVKEVGKGTRVAVVVSAMGKTTDILLNTARNASNGKVDKKELDDILAMGERTSIRIFAAALKTSGVESRYFDPLDRDWPIITDDSFSDANPILEECERRIEQHVLPWVEKGVVPVIAGFVGRTRDGKVTTLGRGGSDTTAFILAKALKADEVILVTDADGIMSGDPKIVAHPRRIKSIDVNTLVGLADSGTKFIHSKALKYKHSSVDVRVINHERGDLNDEGTLITGALLAELDIALAYSSPVASVTVLGQRLPENSGIIQEIIEKAKIYSAVFGLSLNSNSIILYISQQEGMDLLLNIIHEIVVNHPAAIAMSVKRDLAFLKVSGVGLEETHGIIGKISETLRLNRINIFGILTITSSILLFVDWNERERALELIKKSLGGERKC